MVNVSTDYPAILQFNIVGLRATWFINDALSRCFLENCYIHYSSACHLAGMSFLYSFDHDVTFACACCLCCTLSELVSPNISLVIGLIAFQQVQFRWWSAVLFYERKRDVGIYYIVSFIFPSSIWLDRPLCQAVGGWIQDGMMLISHGGFTFQYNCD